VPVEIKKRGGVFLQEGSTEVGPRQWRKKLGMGDADEEDCWGWIKMCFNLLARGIAFVIETLKPVVKGGMCLQPGNYETLQLSGGLYEKIELAGDYTPWARRYHY